MISSMYIGKTSSFKFCTLFLFLGKELCVFYIYLQILAKTCEIVSHNFFFCVCMINENSGDMKLIALWSCMCTSVCLYLTRLWPFELIHIDYDFNCLTLHIFVLSHSRILLNIGCIFY